MPRPGCSPLSAIAGAAPARRPSGAAIPAWKTKIWWRRKPTRKTSAIQAGSQRRLDVLIAACREEFREVLILREMEDLSYREIADITGAPIGTVMSRLARARAMLRETAKDCL